MVRKCKEDAEKTRKAVLESALDVFAEKGYAKTTFDEIAARAGFTKGAIYWYFRNKADLVAALIVEYVQRQQKEIVASLPEENTLEDLLKYFQKWAKLSRDDMRFAKFSRFVLCQMEWSEAVIERVDKNLNEIKDFHLEKINKVLLECQENGLLKDGLDIERLKYLILSDYMGIMFSALSRRYSFDCVDMVSMNLKLLFDSIRK